MTTPTTTAHADLPDTRPGEVVDPNLKNCTACGHRPTSIWVSPHDGSVHEEYDNALVVSLHGGYAMFFDNLDGGDPTLVLCHDCAHGLCDANPWLAKILDPARSHSHRTEYIEAHPDHYGWDYDRRAEESQ